MTFALTTAEQLSRDIDAMIEEICPGAGRRAMYGGIVCELEPGNHKTMVCGYFIYKHHMSLEFTNGAELDDPGGVLEGSGKYRRHIKLSRESDLEDKSVRSIVTAAFELAGGLAHGS